MQEKENLLDLESDDLVWEEDEEEFDDDDDDNYD